MVRKGGKPSAARHAGAAAQTAAAAAAFLRNSRLLQKPLHIELAALSTEPRPAMISRLICSLAFNGSKIQNFTRHALGHHLEWAAANLAIGYEPVRTIAGINGQFQGLTAKRTVRRYA